MPARSPNQYIVVREWDTAKRTNRVAAGPYPTRAKAQAAIKRHQQDTVDWYVYSVYHIVLFHQTNVHTN